MAKRFLHGIPEQPTASAPGEQKARIRQRVHELYEAHGKEDGYEVEDWFQAEAAIIAGKPQERKPVK